MQQSGPIFNKCFSERGILKPSQMILQKGLTEMLIQKMTANAWPVLAVGVFGALLCCLWGKWFLGWGFYGFSGGGGGLWYCRE